MGGRQYKPIEGFDSLTKRELEVLKFVAEGKDNMEIGRELFISKSSVRGHMKSIYFKLGFNDILKTKRLKFIVYAIKVLKMEEAYVKEKAREFAELWEIPLVETEDFIHSIIKEIQGVKIKK